MEKKKWLILLWVVFWASTSWTARHRIYRKQTMLSFLMPYLFSELPQLFLLQNIVILRWLVKENKNKLARFPFDLTLGALLLSSLRAFNIFSDSLRSKTHFQDALRAGGIQTSRYFASWNSGKLFGLLLPLPQVFAGGIHCYRGLVYAKVDGKKLKMDVYQNNLAYMKKELARATTPLVAEPAMTATFVPSSSSSSSSSSFSSTSISSYLAAPSSSAPAFSKQPLSSSSNSFSVSSPSNSSSTTTRKSPIFLYVHGGGWITGHRFFHSLPLLFALAKEGYTVVSINYRLSPSIAFPEHLVDCKRAIAFLRQNAHKIFPFADPSLIFVGGESAGGHLVSLLALTADDKKYQPGFEEVDTSVQACVDLYGPHDFTDSEGHHKRHRGDQWIKFLSKQVMQKDLQKDREDFENASPALLVKRKLRKIQQETEGYGSRKVDGKLQSKNTVERQGRETNEQERKSHVKAGLHDSPGDRTEPQYTFGAAKTSANVDAYTERAPGTANWLQNHVDEHNRIERQVCNDNILLLDSQLCVPPILSIHGVLDTLVPIEDSRYFHDLLKAFRAESSKYLAEPLTESPIETQLARTMRHEEPEVARRHSRTRSEEEIQKNTNEMHSAASTSATTVPSHHSVGPRNAFRPSRCFVPRQCMESPYYTPDVLIEVPGAHHAFNMIPSMRTYAMNEAVVTFLNDVRDKIYAERSAIERQRRERRDEAEGSDLLVSATAGAARKKSTSICNTEGSNGQAKQYEAKDTDDAENVHEVGDKDNEDANHLASKL